MICNNELVDIRDPETGGLIKRASELRCCSLRSTKVNQLIASVVVLQAKGPGSRYRPKTLRSLLKQEQKTKF